MVSFFWGKERKEIVPSLLQPLLPLSNLSNFGQELRIPRNPAKPEEKSSKRLVDRGWY